MQLWEYVLTKTKQDLGMVYVDDGECHRHINDLVKKALNIVKDKGADVVPIVYTRDIEIEKIMTPSEICSVDTWIEASGACFAGHNGDSIDAVAAEIEKVSAGYANRLRYLKNKIMVSDSGILAYAEDLCKQLYIPLCSAAVKAVIAFTLGHELAHVNQAKRLVEFKNSQMANAIAYDPEWYAAHIRESDADIRGYPLAQQIFAEL